MRKVEVTSGWVLRSRSRTSWDTASEIRDASKVKRRGTCAFRPTSADGGYLAMDFAHQQPFAGGRWTYRDLYQDTGGVWEQYGSDKSKPLIEWL